MSAKRYVRHVKRPEWGIGLILHEREGKLDIRFEHAGDKSLLPNPTLLEDVDAEAVSKESSLHAKATKPKRAPTTGDPLEAEKDAVVLRALSLLLRDRTTRAFAGDQTLDEAQDEAQDEDAVIAMTAVTRWVEDIAAFLGVPAWRVKKASLSDAKRIAQREGGGKLAASLIARLSVSDRAAETSTLMARGDAIEIARDVIGALSPFGEELEEAERSVLDDAIPWDAVRASRAQSRERSRDKDEDW